MKSEIKEKVQGTNSDGKETRTQINSLEQKEEINSQPEQNEETRIQKYEERLRNLQDNFKCSNIQIIGVPEGKQEEQGIENLLEKIMKKTSPICEGSRHASPGSSESQRNWIQGETHQDTS